MIIKQVANDNIYFIKNHANDLPNLGEFKSGLGNLKNVPFTFKNDMANLKFDHLEDYKKSNYNVARIQYNGDVVLFNNVTNACVFLDFREYNLFYKFDQEFFESELFSKFIELGFVVPSHFDEKQKVEYESDMIVYQKERIKVFTFIITQQCNARCFYCFEEKEKKISMSSEVLEDIISYMLKNIEDGDQITLDFFGGEPLLAAKQIDIITDRLKKFIKENNYNIEWNSCFTSNGILASNNIISKMRTLWNTKWIQITIDGLEDEHNKRKNIYDAFNAYKVTMDNIEKLLENNIQVSIRLNFDKINILQIDGIMGSLTKFKKYGDLFDVFYAILKNINKNSPDYYNVDEYGPVHKYICSKMIEYGFYTEDYLLPRFKNRSCQACNPNSVVFDCLGGIYKCAQLFDDKENIIGDCKKGMYFNKAFFNWTSNLKLLDECEDCKFFPVCLGGCKYHHYKKTGCSPCVKYKHIFNDLADLYYQLHFNYENINLKQIIKEDNNPRLKHELAVLAIDKKIILTDEEIINLLKESANENYVPAINSLGILADKEEFKKFNLGDAKTYFYNAKVQGYLISEYNYLRKKLDESLSKNELKEIYNAFIELKNKGIDKALKWADITKERI